MPSTTSFSIRRNPTGPSLCCGSRLNSLSPSDNPSRIWPTRPLPSKVVLSLLLPPSHTKPQFPGSNHLVAQQQMQIRQGSSRGERMSPLLSPDSVLHVDNGGAEGCSGAFCMTCVSGCAIVLFLLLTMPHAFVVSERASLSHLVHRGILRQRRGYIQLIAFVNTHDVLSASAAVANSQQVQLRRRLAPIDIGSCVCTQMVRHKMISQSEVRIMTGTESVIRCDANAALIFVAVKVRAGEWRRRMSWAHQEHDLCHDHDVHTVELNGWRPCQDHHVRVSLVLCWLSSSASVGLTESDVSSCSRSVVLDSFSSSSAVLAPGSVSRDGLLGLLHSLCFAADGDNACAACLVTLNGSDACDLPDTGLL
mmetsp:Transcript_10866/g.30000  ORF Transcript_10866/g.30000 Transcript_10866/m.30000 type:complete len:364 (-) Transcript_10866:396-1487(-)